CFLDALVFRGPLRRMLLLNRDAPHGFTNHDLRQQLHHPRDRPSQTIGSGDSALTPPHRRLDREISTRDGGVSGSPAVASLPRTAVDVARRGRDHDILEPGDDDVDSVDGGPLVGAGYRDLVVRVAL